MQINNTTIEVVKGSVLAQDVDAIVNAANKELSNGGGITERIFDAAGPNELAKEIRQKFPNGTPTGTAVVTEGFKLGKKIIHAPGPKWGRENGKEANLLEGCYRSCLEVADTEGIESIAFCSISTGIFKYPLGEAAPLAVKTVVDYLNTHQESSLRRVVFAMWGQEEYDVFSKVLKNQDLEVEARTEAVLDALLGPNRPKYKQSYISQQEFAGLSNLRMLRGFEGGSVSLAEGDDKFYVITNESAMADFMDEGDQVLAGNHATEFDTEEERTAYLKKRRWIATPLNPDGVDSLRQ